MHNVIISDQPKAQEGSIIQYTRSDGFNVFLDGDKELDFIRLHSKPETVIKAVAIRRAQQIARNYARSYRPELLHKFQIGSLTGKKLLKGKEK